LYTHSPKMPGPSPKFLITSQKIKKLQKKGGCR
jgi:hypothetical protein